jgi:hypothetical protein
MKKHLKHKGKNGRAKTKAKNEITEWQLEGKNPPFSSFLFFSMVFFYFLLHEKKKMP